MSFNLNKAIKESIACIESQISMKPKIGIILGSGLGQFTEEIDKETKIEGSQIPNYPQSTVEGHSGILIFGKINEIPVVAVQGRTHYYEGHTIQNVAFVVRLLARVGVRLLIVTNAAGGINSQYKPGDLMIIQDHINLMFNNPLRGAVFNRELRWPDMYNAYDEEVSSLIEKVGLKLKIPIKKGVLLASTGPSYETVAEVQMARKFRADAITMSTIPEVIVAKANQMKVVGISCITNMATGISNEILSHKDVIKIALKIHRKFRILLKEVILNCSRV